MTERKLDRTPSRSPKKNREATRTGFGIVRHYPQEQAIGCGGENFVADFGVRHQPLVIAAQLIELLTLAQREDNQSQRGQRHRQRKKRRCRT